MALSGLPTPSAPTDVVAFGARSHGPDARGRRFALTQACPGAQEVQPWLGRAPALVVADSVEGAENDWAVAFADEHRGWLVGTEGRILKDEL
jgi:hypothetical protein